MSAKQGFIQGDWENNKNKITVSVPLIFFEEDNSQIVYCPHLDVYGYGKTEEEAYESFVLSLGEFFQYTTNKGTFYEELERLGWKMRKSKYKKMSSPPISDLLSENDNFRRIFDNYPFRKEERKIQMPA